VRAVDRILLPEHRADRSEIRWSVSIDTHRLWRHRVGSPNASAYRSRSMGTVIRSSSTTGFCTSICNRVSALGAVNPSRTIRATLGAQCKRCAAAAPHPLYANGEQGGGESQAMAARTVSESH
jgi:hypothetical protein